MVAGRNAPPPTEPAPPWPSGFRLERLPDRGTPEFKAWIDQHGIYYFGDPAAGTWTGREGWFGMAGCYLRGNRYCLWLDGEPTMLSGSDLVLYAQEFERLSDELRQAQADLAAAT